MNPVALLFAPLCLGCQVLLSPRGHLRFDGVLCHRCSVAATVLPSHSTDVGGITAVLPYEAPWSTALTRLKFGGQRGMAGPLGALLYPALARPHGRWDLLVPVPLHWRRRLRRGYDQTVLLARAACRHGPGPTLAVGVLRRDRATTPQSRLDAHARARNVVHAFSVRNRHRSKVAGRRVLVVDDVTTTGATLRAACEALTAAGAADVAALALLRTLA